MGVVTIKTEALIGEVKLKPLKKVNMFNATPKKADKISKQEQKTKLLELKELTEREKIAASKEVKQAKKETKQNRSDNKKEVKTDLFRNFTKMITKSIWSLGLFASLCYLVPRLFEGVIKASPIGAFFNFKKQE
jgi:Fe2+ transport system protein B